MRKDTKKLVDRIKALEIGKSIKVKGKSQNAVVLNVEAYQLGNKYATKEAVIPSTSQFSVKDMKDHVRVTRKEDKLEFTEKPECVLPTEAQAKG